MDVRTYKHKRPKREDVKIFAIGFIGFSFLCILFAVGGSCVR